MARDNLSEGGGEIEETQTKINKPPPNSLNAIDLVIGPMRRGGHTKPPG